MNDSWVACYSKAAFIQLETSTGCVYMDVCVSVSVCVSMWCVWVGVGRRVPQS